MTLTSDTVTVAGNIACTAVTSGAWNGTAIATDYIANSAVTGAKLATALMAKDNFILTVQSGVTRDASSTVTPEIWRITLGAHIGATKKPIDPTSIMVWVNGSVPFLASDITTMGDGQGDENGYYYDASVGTYGTFYLGGNIVSGAKVTVWYIGE